jgi:hypothetical protein
MEETLQAQLTVLGNEVGALAIPDRCKQTAAWCLGQLPPLYAKFRQTSESRYGEEITRLVQGVVKELIQNKATCPEAQCLAASMTDRLRALHEQLGLPGLKFKPLGASASRGRKAS